MTENKYLEKIALRREKAEAMARAARVITDPSSNWKYALRQFRDGRGDVVTGAEWKRVADKLAGGVDVRREHQQLSAVQRTLRDVDEAQEVFHNSRSITGKVGLPGVGHLTPQSAATDIVDSSPQLGQFSKAILEKYRPGVQGLSNAHVHPGPASATTPALLASSREMRQEESVLRGTDKLSVINDLDHRFFSGYPHRLAAPSGEPHQRAAFRHMSPPERRSISSMVGTATKSMENAYVKGDREAFLEASDVVPEARRRMTMSQAKASAAPTIGDERMFDETYHGSINRIHAPSVHTVGLFKSTKGPEGFTQGKRSVYLDLTPRAKRD